MIKSAKNERMIKTEKRMNKKHFEINRINRIKSGLNPHN